MYPHRSAAAAPHVAREPFADSLPAAGAQAPEEVRHACERIDALLAQCDPLSSDELDTRIRVPARGRVPRDAQALRDIRLALCAARSLLDRELLAWQGAGDAAAARDAHVRLIRAVDAARPAEHDLQFGVIVVQELREVGRVQAGRLTPLFSETALRADTAFTRKGDSGWGMSVLEGIAEMVRRMPPGTCRARAGTRVHLPGHAGALTVEEALSQLSQARKDGRRTDPMGLLGLGRDGWHRIEQFLRADVAIPLLDHALAGEVPVLRGSKSIAAVEVSFGVAGHGRDAMAVKIHLECRVDGGRLPPAVLRAVFCVAADGNLIGVAAGGCIRA